MSVTKTQAASEKNTVEYYTVHGTNRNKPRSMYYTDELEDQIDLVRKEASTAYPLSKKQWIEQALIEKVIAERQRLGLTD